MAKIYVQNAPVVLSRSGSLAANGSLSGSLPAAGYAKLVGLFRSDVATETASGLRIEHSTDYGANWDYVSASDAVGASTTSACLADVMGNAVRVTIKNGATAASALRALFVLRPI